jgi:FtsH-binding integral membrane protein
MLFAMRSQYPYVPCMISLVVCHAYLRSSINSRGRPRGEDDAGHYVGAGLAGLDSGPGSAERGTFLFFSFSLFLSFFLGLLSGDMHGVGGFIAFFFFFSPWLGISGVWFGVGACLLVTQS